MSVAVLSGGAGAIAGASAERLIEQGARVALLDRDADAVDAAAERLRATGGTVLALRADVADDQELAEAFECLRAELGPASMAVSAVAHEEHGGWDDVESADVERALRVTVGGTLAFCRLAARQMSVAGGGGRIVLVSSLHAVLPFAGALAYNAAQGGLRQLGLSLARELLPEGIAVNLVEPGWIDTPGERRWYSEDELAAAARELPWGRLGSPDDVAAVVGFLCSEQADYVTGATVRVDGGMALAMANLPQERS